MVITKASFKINLYKEISGKVPVLEWLKDFNKEERQIIDGCIKYPQYSWPWEMPRIKPFGGGLMEIRIKLPNKQARIFLYFMMA